MSFKKDVINSQMDLHILSKSNDEIIVKAKFGPSKPTNIPLIINESLSCFVAAVIGDGHIRKNKFQVYLDGTNQKLIRSFQDITKSLFKRDFNISCDIPRNKFKRYCLIIDSKAIHNLLTIVFETPAGKKSHLVKVPEYIKNSNVSIKAAFLIGILVTEGGRRRREYGLSTASKTLREELTELFNDLGIEVKLDEWTHKVYNKKYYGLVFRKKKLSEIISKCEDQNIKLLINCCLNFC